MRMDFTKEINENLVARVRELEHEIGCLLDEMSFYGHADRARIIKDDGAIARRALKRSEKVLGPL
jgi:hypothetical protein